MLFGIVRFSLRRLFACDMMEETNWGGVMNQDIIQRLLAFSDEYSGTLWKRFQRNESASPEERDFFQHIHDNYDVGQSALPDIKEILSDPVGANLAGSLFRPGAADNIFINVHAPFLNHWIHSHEFFEIIYIAQGSAVDWIDGVEVTLKTRELCIHNPNARHQILKMTEGEDLILNILLPVHLFRRSFYALFMGNEELDQFFNNYMLTSDTNPNYMAFHDTTARVDTIMELLAEEFLRREHASRFVMESTLVVLFGELMRNFHSDSFMRELVGYISANLTDISMQDAAAHFGYHKNYLPHIIKKHSSHSFWGLVTEIRIQKASSLLLFTNRSIEDISALVGYRSTASFYEHFHKRYHMTPKDYRQQM